MTTPNGLGPHIVLSFLHTAQITRGLSFAPLPHPLFLIDKYLQTLNPHFSSQILNLNFSFKFFSKLIPFLSKKKRWRWRNQTNYLKRRRWSRSWRDAQAWARSMGTMNTGCPSMCPRGISQSTSERIEAGTSYRSRSCLTRNFSVFSGERRRNLGLIMKWVSLFPVKKSFSAL